MADWNFLNYEGLEYYDNKSEVRTDEKIAVETERAKKAEKNNATSINNEVARATNAENTLATNLSSHTSNNSINPHGVTKAQVGLGNVDNTSDANKPISTATKTALNAKAPLASPTLTGTPKAPTASAGTNTTQIATTAFVQTAVSNLVDSAPETLNTLNELSAALGDDPNFATTIATQLGNKVDKVSGKGLSTNDYTTTEKTKLSGIATGAEVNQNTFSNIKVGSTTIAADSKTDTLTLVGSNVTLTPDATNDKVTIGITSENITSALGYTPSINDTTYGVATTSSNGLMSSADKTKLNYTNIAYATCSTAAATVAKIITISGNTNWKLTVGSMIVVKFSYTNTASNPTFNVNSTGAKSVWYNTSLITTSNLGYAGTANRPMNFVYDGTQYVFVGWSLDNNSDTKATQTNTTTNADYRVVLSTNANDTTETNALRKSANFTANPNTGAFYARGYDRIDITGHILDLDTLTLSAGSPEIMRYIEKTSGGATNITNIPVTGQPFILDVELVRWASTSDYITKQTFVSVGAKANEYVRYCTSGTWDSWTKRVFTDNNTTYSAATTSANGLMTSTDKAKLNYTNIAYGTCSTDAATAAKVVTISGNTNWALTVGSIIVVKFTVTNTASSVTLNVNNTGAKSIWYNNAVYTSNSNSICGFANRYTTYMYDGTNWVWISNGTDNNSTYTPATLGQGYGTCATAEATVAKVVTLSSYSLVTGGIVAVKFTYAVPASATMNINSKGAKSIYYRGAAITSGIIKAGDIGVFMYNGTQYHLLTVDRDNNTTYTLNYDKDNSELQLKSGDSVVSAVTIIGDSSDDFLKIVTWADGTYEEISAMLDAHYAGLIDISDYWSVGDVRTIPLSAMSATGVGESQSAQNAEVVIIGFGHDDLVSPVNGNSKSAVSLQLKNSLETTGYMYSAYISPSYSLWDGSPRRTWCNGVFKNALPAELVNLIKTVTKKTWRYAHSSYSGYSSYRTQQTTNDDCFLISEFEVFGVQELSTSAYGTVGDDGTQYEYYKTSSNRIKYLGVSGTSANIWWLRSSNVYFGGDSNFRYVSTSGSVSNSSASKTYGVAPGFCI